MTEAEGIRLQKVLATAGMGSRRACEELIEQGRVEVDGKVVREQGMRVDPNSSVIHVDGMRVTTAPGLMYLMFNKPRGVITAMSDPEGRPTVGDYVADKRDKGLFHVGRLDAETEGLLLLTNDGELANRLAHPSHEVAKTYLAHVEGRVGPSVGQAMLRGIELEDGVVTPIDVDAEPLGKGRWEFFITIAEGRNREVRRVCEALGLTIERLVRVRFGPVRLGSLAPGASRALTVTERRTIDALSRGQPLS